MPADSSTPDASLIRALEDILGPGGVVSSPEGRLTYECDMHTFYKGAPEASKVPPEWHAWLHSHLGQPPVQGSQPKSWQKPHLPNLTGTSQAYLPPGHTSMGGHRAKATGDYEPWTPA